jgi:hypothetical protein
MGYIGLILSALLLIFVREPERRVESKTNENE